MQKVFVTSLLTAVCANAMAEWVEVGRNDKGITYADPSTIRKAGNLTKMWDLMDHKVRVTSPSSGKTYLSSKTQYEYDCAEEQVRVLYFSWHSGHMGAGEVVTSSTIADDKWSPIPPGSITETLWKYACGKL